MRSAPLFFVRGGAVDPGTTLYSAGNNGNYWSSVGRSRSDAYHLDFSSGDVYPSGYYVRHSGFSVRCVAVSS